MFGQHVGLVHAARRREWHCHPNEGSVFMYDVNVAVD